MKKIPGNQQGSVIVTILVLALMAYGVFVGIQYVPLKIESSSVDSLLDNIEADHKATPIGSVSDVKDKINNILYINQLDHLRDSFIVRRYRGSLIIEVKYERELNLIYENKVMLYEKSLTIK